MPKYIFINKFIMIVLFMSLVGCGGSGGEGSSGSGETGTAVVLSGQVADGYLSGARVFLDRNGNRLLDGDEPWTESGAQGHFSLDVRAGEGDIYPVVAEIIAGITIDEDYPQQYVAESYRLDAPAGKWSFISPLTSLVKSELDKNPSLSLSEAETRIREQLGLDAGTSLFEDYIRSGSNPMFISAQRAARIVAGLMGTLATEIDHNLGTWQAEAQRGAISLIISDQILNNSNTIAQGLTSAIDDAAIEGIKTVILTNINTSGLDSELLDLYVERMQAANPVWDITPPRVINMSPFVNGSASVNAVIALTFNEEVDPASVFADSLQLIGPGGAVNGTLEYNPDLKQLTFTPLNYLMAFSQYQIEFMGVSDPYGNSIAQSQIWTFETIFDQLPPGLPDF